MSYESTMRLIFGQEWGSADFKEDDLSRAVRSALLANSDEDALKPDQLMNIVRTFTKLARQLSDDQAISELRNANDWLEVFEPTSSAGWAKAKSAFIEDGPAVLDALSSFTDWIRTELQIGLLLAHDTESYLYLLRTIQRSLSSVEWKDDWMETTYGDSGSIDTRIARRVEKMEVSDQMRTRVSNLLRNVFEPEADTLNNKGSPKLILSCIADTFEERRRRNPKSLSFGLRNEMTNFLYSTRRILQSNRDMPAWLGYKQKIRDFVRQVGCAKVHDTPQENIAELRLFYSTTIGYFAKLQEQYVNKVLEVKALRHHISALEFRSLLENLTPPHIPKDKVWGDQSVGPRWMKFWELALNEEYAREANPSKQKLKHALKDVVDKRNPKRVHQDKGVTKIHTEGQNGQLYRKGRDLYGTLSSEIHEFKGKKFEVGEDDGWTILDADTMRALRPLDSNIDDHGIVDWVEERKRYL